MLDRVRVFLKIFGFWLLYFWVARVLFLGYHHARVTALTVTDLLGGFGSGFRLDLSGAAYLTAVPAALLVFSSIRASLPWVRRLISGWMFLAVVGVSILVAADLELFGQWDKRIDASVLWYLKTPAEAWASTGGTPRLWLLILAVAMAGTATAAFRRVIGPDLRRLEPISPLFALPLVLLIGLLVVPARGGLQTWPLTGSSAYQSADPFVNQAAQNAAWGFFDSVYRRLYDRTNPYAALPRAEALAITTRPAPAGEVPSRLLTTNRPNIVVIIWESASALAFGSLGGRPGVTPRTDSLARQGLLFRRFYAAGDRTDKGVAAILSGFPALPRGSIMMVPATIADVLSAPPYDFSLDGGGFVRLVTNPQRTEVPWGTHTVELRGGAVVLRDPGAQPRDRLGPGLGRNQRVVQCRLQRWDDPGHHHDDRQSPDWH